jgi:hypothetical protein
MACGRDLALQFKLMDEEDEVTLVCSTLAEEECCHLITWGVDSAWETHKSLLQESIGLSC